MISVHRRGFLGRVFSAAAVLTVPVTAIRSASAAQRLRTPCRPCGIESLQQMRTQFLICANALGGWCAELEARGKGTASDLNEELRANMLPGVRIVPAMVIAIEQAQAAGIAYNRQ